MVSLDPNRDSRGIPKRLFSVLLPLDLLDRLEKICPDELSLGETIRQILEGYVGIVRPINAYSVEATPEEQILVKQVKEYSRRREYSVEPE